MAGTWQAAFSAPLAIDFGSRNLTILWASLPIIGAMLIGAGIIAAVKRWRETPRTFRLTASEQLAQFRSLYEKGELSEEEFNRLQAVLGERIKRELNLPAAASAVSAPQSAEAPAVSTVAPEAEPRPAVSPSANGAPPAAEGLDPPGPQGLPARQD